MMGKTRVQIPAFPQKTHRNGEFFFVIRVKFTLVIITKVKTPKIYSRYYYEGKNAENLLSFIYYRHKKTPT